MHHKTPEQAERAFLKTIRQSVGFITKKDLIVNGDRNYGPSCIRALSFAKGEPIHLDGKHDIWLNLIQHFVVVENKKTNLWHVRTVYYRYTFYVDKANVNCELIAFQWHPKGANIHFGHLHLCEAAQVGQQFLANAHLPTNRIAIEDVVGLAIREFKVPSLQKDWRPALRQAKLDFQKHLRWLIEHHGFLT